MSKFAIRRFAKARAGAVIVIEKKSGKRVYIKAALRLGQPEVVIVEGEHNFDRQRDAGRL